MRLPCFRHERCEDRMIFLELALAATAAEQWLQMCAGKPAVTLELGLTECHQ